MYNNEADVGAAIKDSGVARAELFITTKLWTTNLTPPLVASSFAESLEKLQMDYVDLLLIHWPNPAVPLGETLAAMQDLMRQKKTKAIGVSNFPVKLMREAIETHKAPIACNQVEYHVMLSQAAVLDYARKHNIIVTAYSPLGRGGLHKNQLLTEIGHHYGKTGSQVALRWLIEQDGVAAIPKAASAKNAQANFNIFDFELSDKDCQAITKLSGNNRLIDPDFAPKWDAA
jgi:2,5-diketo-D-gluconate reductase B